MTPAPRTITDAAFVGVGELPSGRYPERSFMGDCIASAYLALEDAHVFEVYDSYAAVLAIAMEGLGMCKPGEGARTIASGITSPGEFVPTAPADGQRPCPWFRRA